MVTNGLQYSDALSASYIAAMYSKAIVLVVDSNLKNIITQYISGKLAQVNYDYIFGLQDVVL